MIYLGHVTLIYNAINTVITLVIQLITASQASISCNNIGSMAQVCGSVVQSPFVFTDTHIQISHRIILLKRITLRMKSSFHDPVFDLHVPGEVPFQGEFAGTVEALKWFTV